MLLSIPLINVPMKCCLMQSSNGPWQWAEWRMQSVFLLSLADGAELLNFSYSMSLRPKQDYKNQSILGIDQTTCLVFRGHLNFRFSEQEGKLFCKAFCGCWFLEVLKLRFLLDSRNKSNKSRNKKYHPGFHHRLPLIAVYLEKYRCCKSREAPLVAWRECERQWFAVVSCRNTPHQVHQRWF